MKIGHDNSGSGPDWFLSEVTVDIVSHGERYMFNCSRWIAVDKEDNQLEIEVTPTNQEDIPKSK